jgi:hypothetical protein
LHQEKSKNVQGKEKELIMLLVFWVIKPWELVRRYNILKKKLFPSSEWKLLQYCGSTAV